MKWFSLYICIHLYIHIYIYIYSFSDLPLCIYIYMYIYCIIHMGAIQVFMREPCIFCKNCEIHSQPHMLNTYMVFLTLITWCKPMCSIFQTLNPNMMIHTVNTHWFKAWVFYVSNIKPRHGNSYWWILIKIVDMVVSHSFHK